MADKPGADRVSVERAGMLMADAAYEEVKAERDVLRRRLDKANAVCVAVDRYWMGKPMPYQVSAALTEWWSSGASDSGGETHD